MISPGLSSRLVFLMKLMSLSRALRALAEFKILGRSGFKRTFGSVIESMASRSFLTETSPMPERTLLQTRARLTLSRSLMRRRRTAMASLISLRS